jgi:hypothetical protein
MDELSRRGALKRTTSATLLGSLVTLSVPRKPAVDATKEK